MKLFPMVLIIIKYGYYDIAKHFVMVSNGVFLFGFIGWNDNILGILVDNQVHIYIYIYIIYILYMLTRIGWLIGGSKIWIIKNITILQNSYMYSIDFHGIKYYLTPDLP